MFLDLRPESEAEDGNPAPGQPPRTASEPGDSASCLKIVYLAGAGRKRDVY